jgi:hypothetical protein
MKQDRRLEPVRCFIALLSLSLLFSLSACQSDQPTNVYPTPVNALGDARDAPVALPATTPFDATPKLRAEYLEAYPDGYRSGLTGMNILFRKPSETTQTVRAKGWRDGADAGLKEYFYRKKRR